MNRHLLAMLMWLLVCGQALAAEAVETAHLSVYDATGNLGWERLAELEWRWLESLKGGDLDALSVERLARILGGVASAPCERERRMGGNSCPTRA
jgi:hypothetical protein